jgi:hypothetical protein
VPVTSNVADADQVAEDRSVPVTSSVADGKSQSDPNESKSNEYLYHSECYECEPEINNNRCANHREHDLKMALHIYNMTQKDLRMQVQRVLGVLVDNCMLVHAVDNALRDASSVIGNGVAESSVSNDRANDSDDRVTVNAHDVCDDDVCGNDCNVKMRNLHMDLARPPLIDTIQFNEDPLADKPDHAFTITDDASFSTTTHFGTLHRHEGITGSLGAVVRGTDELTMCHSLRGIDQAYAEQVLLGRPRTGTDVQSRQSRNASRSTVSFASWQRDRVLKRPSSSRTTVRPARVSKRANSSRTIVPSSRTRNVSTTRSRLAKRPKMYSVNVTSKRPRNGGKANVVRQCTCVRDDELSCVCSWWRDADTSSYEGNEETSGTAVTLVRAERSVGSRYGTTEQRKRASELLWQPRQDPGQQSRCVRF